VGRSVSSRVPSPAPPEQTPPGDVDVEAMRAGVRNRDRAANAEGVSRGDYHDLRRAHDVDVKHVGDRIADGRARPAGTRGDRRRRG
jgi:hypothetical protein